VNRGVIYHAVRFADEKGHAAFYTPTGQGLRKALLRAPINFRRISSRFSRGRLHPILRIRRPHLGVDYAAAIGTPIKAAGDGKVVLIGRAKGYGNSITLRHNSEYTTIYGHMSSFARGLRCGSTVHQGQIIGSVG
jgi:murein DD-endopeptidase MepM/ murein hydrolase activator NlpD